MDQKYSIHLPESMKQTLRAHETVENWLGLTPDFLFLHKSNKINLRNGDTDMAQWANKTAVWWLRARTKSSHADYPPEPKLRPTVNTRQSRVVQDYKCNTKRYKKSSLPFLASLLNKKWIMLFSPKLCYSVTCGWWEQCPANGFGSPWVISLSCYVLYHL